MKARTRKQSVLPADKMLGDMGGDALGVSTEFRKSRRRFSDVGLGAAKKEASLVNVSDLDVFPSLCVECQCNWISTCRYMIMLMVPSTVPTVPMFLPVYM